MSKPLTIRTAIARTFLHNFVAVLALACVLMFGLASQDKESSGKPSNAPKLVRTTKSLITIAAFSGTAWALTVQPAPFDLGANVAPSNTPAWTNDVAARFPSCVKHREGVVAVAVVVVDSGAGVSRMSVDRAYALNTDGERANNVWVIGSCA